MPRAYLKACLNGARRAASAPAVPESPDAVAREAAAALAAGADALHVHTRGPDGAESLAAGDVARTLEAVRAACPGAAVGVSTGAWIVHDPQERMRAVQQWRALPDFASVNFSEAGAVELATLLMGRGVGVESGIWNASDARALVASGLAARCLRILVEPTDRELEAALRNVAEIEAVLDGLDDAPPRLLHGGRATAWPLLREAVARGYQARIGLEDTLTLPDGSPAGGNAELVAAARRIEAEVGGEQRR